MMFVSSAAQDHRNHTFEKLSVAYGRHKKKIRLEAAGLRKRRKVQIIFVENWMIRLEFLTLYGGEVIFNLKLQMI